MVRVLTGLFILSILSACAVVDLSSQESARALKPGQFEISAYSSSGLNLYSTTHFDNIMAQLDST